MGFYLPYLDEPFATEITVEWFYERVSVLMALQALFSFETVSTGKTYITLIKTMCASITPEKENDLFHNIVMTEELSYQSGFEEGQRVSVQTATADGYKLGVEKGLEIGKEIGFYSGFSKHILERSDADKLSPRTVRVCHDIIALTHRLTLTSPTDADLTDLLAKVKGKFKQLTSLLGVQTQFSTDASGASF